MKAKAPIQAKAAAESSLTGLQADSLRRPWIAAGLDDERDLDRSKLPSGPSLTGNRAQSIGLPPVVQEVLRAPGQPLEPATRAFMESRFGHDFSQVRVHTDAKAAESARAVNARAYTVGRDVVFGEGGYAPDTSEGRRLMAHELAHVVQQQPGSITQPPGEGQEREAATIAESIIQSGSPVSIHAVSAPGIARNGAGQPLVSRVTPEIEKRLTEELQKARVAAPPSPSISAERTRTFGAAAIIKPEGNVTYVTSSFMTKGDPHAEVQLLDIIKGQVTQADTVAILVDAEVCVNCKGELGKFSESPEHGSLRVYEVRAVRKDAPPGLDPKTAPKEQLTKPKTAIQRPIEERFAYEVVEVRRVRLPIYHERAPAPDGAPEVPESGTVPKAGELPKAPGGAEVERRGLGRGGSSATRRFVKGAGGFIKGMFSPQNLAIAVLDMATAYLVAKREQELAVRVIKSALEATDVQKRSETIIDQARLEIARKQFAGKSVYLSVGLQLRFKNDVLDSLSTTRVLLADTDESNITSTVMSHEGIPPFFVVETTVWYVTVSRELPDVETSESEEIRFDLEEIEKRLKDPHLDPQTAADIEARRKRLLEELTKAQTAEAKAKEEDVARPGTLADPKKRAQQQVDLAERLRRLPETQKPPAPKQEDKPKGPPSLDFKAPPPGFSLLPGAPGESPIQQAAVHAVWNFEVKARELKQEGENLIVRRDSGNWPSPDEVAAYSNRIKQWNWYVKYMQNWFKDRSRSEVVSELGRLLDQYLPKLKELASRLGANLA